MEDAQASTVPTETARDGENLHPGKGAPQSGCKFCEGRKVGMVTRYG
jgi:hypothetical protein